MCAGDMGGYMGLLIGASIVTICELLDFIVHTVLLRHRGSAADRAAGRKKGVANGREEVAM